MTKAGERIKSLRKENNLSLVVLSKLTGLSKSAINRWENNQADINGDAIVALAKFFEVTADYLLGLTDY